MHIRIIFGAYDGTPLTKYQERRQDAVKGLSPRLPEGGQRWFNTPKGGVIYG